MCLSLYAEPMESPNNPNPNSPSSQKTFGGCRLLLVDGSNLMFQMFYGMPSRIVNKQGVAIHGVLGFVGAFLRIVGLVEPSHILVVFDGEHENPRVLLDDQYKAIGLISLQCRKRRRRSPKCHTYTTLWTIWV